MVDIGLALGDQDLFLGGDPDGVNQQRALAEHTVAIQEFDLAAAVLTLYRAEFRIGLHGVDLEHRVIGLCQAVEHLHHVQAAVCHADGLDADTDAAVLRVVIGLDAAHSLLFHEVHGLNDAVRHTGIGVQIDGASGEIAAHTHLDHSVCYAVHAVLEVIDKVAVGKAGRARGDHLTDYEDDEEEHTDEADRRYARGRAYTPYHYGNSECKGIEDSQYNEDERIDIDKMGGGTFEHFCADLLRVNGWTDVRVTPASDDHGIDITAEKDDIKWGFQCKRWGDTKVDAIAIGQTYKGKALYECDMVAVITTSTLTAQAEGEAKQLGIKVWGRGKIRQLMSKLDNRLKGKNQITEVGAMNNTFNTVEKIVLCFLSSLRLLTK